MVWLKINWSWLNTERPMNENSHKVKKLLDKPPHWTIGWGNTLILGLIGLLVVASFFIYIPHSITIDLEYGNKRNDEEKNIIVNDIIDNLIKVHFNEQTFSDEKTEFKELRNEIEESVSDWLRQSKERPSSLEDIEPPAFENNPMAEPPKKIALLIGLSGTVRGQMTILVPKSLKSTIEIGGKVRIDKVVDNEKNNVCRGTIVGITKGSNQHPINLLIQVDSTDSIKKLLTLPGTEILQIEFMYEGILFDYLKGIITNQGRTLSVTEDGGK